MEEFAKSAFLAEAHTSNIITMHCNKLYLKQCLDSIKVTISFQPESLTWKGDIIEYKKLDERLFINDAYLDREEKTNFEWNSKISYVDQNEKQSFLQWLISVYSNVPETTITSKWISNQSWNSVSKRVKLMRTSPNLKLSPLDEMKEIQKKLKHSYDKWKLSRDDKASSAQLDELKNKKENRITNRIDGIDKTGIVTIEDRLLFERVKCFQKEYDINCRQLYENNNAIESSFLSDLKLLNHEINNFSVNYKIDTSTTSDYRNDIRLTCIKHFREFMNRIIHFDWDPFIENYILTDEKLILIYQYHIDNIQNLNNRIKEKMKLLFTTKSNLGNLKIQIGKLRDDLKDAETSYNEFVEDYSDLLKRNGIIITSKPSVIVLKPIPTPIKPVVSAVAAKLVIPTKPVITTPVVNPVVIAKPIIVSAVTAKPVVPTNTVITATVIKPVTKPIPTKPVSTPSITILSSGSGGSSALEAKSARDAKIVTKERIKFYEKSIEELKKLNDVINTKKSDVEKLKNRINMFNSKKPNEIEKNRQNIIILERVQNELNTLEEQRTEAMNNNKIGDIDILQETLNVVRQDLKDMELNIQLEEEEDL